MLQRMTNPQPGKYHCYFCKGAFNITYWAFVKDKEGLTHPVPCCIRCAKKLNQTLKDEQTKKMVLKVNNEQIPDMFKSERIRQLINRIKGGKKS